jgi:lysophospholipase L1-like esterase
VVIAGRRILIFGDSLTHRGSNDAPNGINVVEKFDRNSSSPGDLLASKLLELGAASARINGKVSRSAYNFFRIENSPILADEVKRKPNLVFIFLGTNDVGLAQKQDQAAFQELHDVFVKGGAEVWAIGPPTLAKKPAGEIEEVYDTLRKVFGANVIDLRSLTQDMTSTGRTSDSTHFTSSGAKLLAGRIAATLRSPAAQSDEPPPTRKELVAQLRTLVTRRAGFLGLGLGIGGAALLLVWAIRRRATRRAGG